MGNPTLPGTRTRSPGWLFWLSWMAASTAAILLGFGIIYASIFIAKTVLPGINEDRLFGGLMFPILATVLGASQWFVLRTRIPKSGWWIPATGVGMLVGMALGGGVVQAISHLTGRQWDVDFQPGLLVLYVLVGFSLALAQLPVLWRHITGFALWLLASMVGWLALGLIMGKSIDRMSDILALGAVPAAFTGFGLMWLIRTPRSQPTRSA
jgi:hypothetical protein